MGHKKKRNIIIGTLCGVLLLMVVGYAAFSSVLNIKGTTNIASNWDIKITSITSKTLSGSATNAKDPEGVGTLEASFETNLVSPGDSMEYTITISNGGNINAKLDKITLSDPDNEYVTFETSGLTEGEKLRAGATADLKVTVTFKDVEISKMEESTSNLKVTLDFSQANVDDNGIAVPITGADNLKDLAVTTGEGLYADEYEAGRYVYKGANPDNYITFNNELWRIISIETDGTLKIMKKDSVKTMAWEASRNDENNTYCQAGLISNFYYGCNAWMKVEGTWTNGSINGTVTQDATINTYLNNETEGVGSYYNTLSNEAKSLIQTHTWGIGPALRENKDLTNQISSENNKTWTGKIGLISASDALRANTNTEQCGNVYLNHINYSTCATTNYIVPTSGQLWTITPETGSASTVYYVDGVTGYITGAGAFNDHLGVYPAVYLISGINLEGEGTETNPYKIV